MQVKDYKYESYCKGVQMPIFDDLTHYHTDKIGNYIEICFKVSFCHRIYFKDNWYYLNCITSDTIKGKQGDFLILKNGVFIFVDKLTFLEKYSEFKG